MTEKTEKTQNPLSEWLRMQLEFQGKLADETLRYLRRLQGAAAPVTPGTVLVPETSTELRAEAIPGGSFEVALEVENLQRVHSIAAPVLDPMVASSGTTWYPEADFSPAFALVAPDSVTKFAAKVSVPSSLPPGTYTGALSLRGLRQQVFRLTVAIAGPRKEAVATTQDKLKASPRSTRPKKAARRKARKS
jgi:hypothetical protein